MTPNFDTLPWAQKIIVCELYAWYTWNFLKGIVVVAEEVQLKAHLPGSFPGIFSLYQFLAYFCPPTLQMGSFARTLQYAWQVSCFQSFKKNLLSFWTHPLCISYRLLYREAGIVVQDCWAWGRVSAFSNFMSGKNLESVCVLSGDCNMVLFICAVFQEFHSGHLKIGLLICLLPVLERKQEKVNQVQSKKGLEWLV